MNRILMILAAVCMAMVLGACGQKEPKPPEVTTPDATMDQPKAMDEAKDAAPAAEAPAANQESTQAPGDVRADASDVNNPANAMMEGADNAAEAAADDAEKAAGQAIDATDKVAKDAMDMDDDDDDDEDDDEDED